MGKKKNFQKRQEQTIFDKLSGNERPGIVVAHFGASVEIEDDEGTLFRCNLRKNAESLITGDRVLWQLERDNTGIVVALLPRSSLLCRPSSSHKAKLIAANIDKMIIVMAPHPLFSSYLLDSYLVAAENLKICPIILLNKTDLLREEDLLKIADFLSIYQKMGYTVIFSSAYIKTGLQNLKVALKNNVSVLVGASGVGKSSIISTLTHHEIMTNAQARLGMGRHTTTLSRLYHLPDKGSLIDSPGVREFSLWHLNPDEVLKGFLDLLPLSTQCQFRNCHHQNEKGCALHQALLEGKINASRFESYQAILKKSE